MNGWTQVGNIFVKKVGEEIYNIVRLEESDSNEYRIYYEYYDGIPINDVTEKTFLPLQLGNLKEFLALKTDEEKAAYVAFTAYNCCSSFPCNNEEEVTQSLKEDGVIPEEETFKLVG